MVSLSDLAAVAFTEILLRLRQVPVGGVNASVLYAAFACYTGQSCAQNATGLSCSAAPSVLLFCVQSVHATLDTLVVRKNSQTSTV